MATEALYVCVFKHVHNKMKKNTHDNYNPRFCNWSHGYSWYL